MSASPDLSDNEGDDPSVYPGIRPPAPDLRESRVGQNVENTAANNGDQPGTITTIEANFRSVSMPDAEELAAYERVVLGSAKMILENTFNDSAHLRDMEKRAIRIEGRDAWMKRVFPFAIVSVFLASATLIAFIGAVAGLIAFAGTLAAVVTAYLKRPVGDESRWDDQ